jgi:hypothetical protein
MGPSFYFKCSFKRIVIVLFLSHCTIEKLVIPLVQSCILFKIILALLSRNTDHKKSPDNFSYCKFNKIDDEV